MANTKLNSDLTHAIGAAVGKSAPPAGIVGLAALGAIDMTFVVGLATVGYIVLQASYLLWKWAKERRESKKFLASMGLPPERKE
ncbi:hypothetical protein [Pseudoxanthomonas sp. CF125]|uniref:hypothetical protein n=1 Tax=Pseudoxanthomonas sp. CF125 TaxID=1855303 RepID=UPI00087FC47D|nr:hypothetical protein [Pseudoxanthomonas sp. CF125]SDQ42520.1 hypothetical protein SAMN05216569_1076 [Pseudoxanthomonas sp. CF125]